MTPQLTVLLKHLKEQKTISQAEAGLIYKIRSLPKRISELKDLGYEITRELKTDPTGQRYARYTYVGKKTPNVTPYEPVDAPIKALNMRPTVGDRVVVVRPMVTGGKYSAGCEGTVVRVQVDKGSLGDDLWVNFDNGNLNVYVWASELEVIAND